jgi:hypothetical protein
MSLHAVVVTAPSAARGANERRQRREPDDGRQPRDPAIGRPASALADAPTAVVTPERDRTDRGRHTGSR